MGDSGRFPGESFGGGDHVHDGVIFAGPKVERERAGLLAQER